MKIKIINKGGYCFGGTLKLPVVVEAAPDGAGFNVKGSELIKRGASVDFISSDFPYYFQSEDFEVVPVKHCKAIRQGDQMQCVCGLAWDIDDTDLPECRV
tara:strand:+ start:817 stop:1116 length:300 start_codon:yes stop_codon:yes gene_type:complete